MDHATSIDIKAADQPHSVPIEHPTITQSINQTNDQTTTGQSNTELNGQANGQPVNRAIDQSPVLYSNSAPWMHEQSTSHNPLSPSSPQSTYPSTYQSNNQSNTNHRSFLQPSPSPPPQPDHQSNDQSNNQSNTLQHDQSRQTITVTPSPSMSSISSHHSTDQPPAFSPLQSPNQPSNLSIDQSVNNLTHLLHSPPPPINNPPLHYNLPVGSTRDRVASESLEALRMPVISPEPSPLLGPLNSRSNSQHFTQHNKPDNQSAVEPDNQGGVLSNFEANKQFSKELQAFDLTAQPVTVVPANQPTDQTSNDSTDPQTVLTLNPLIINRAIPWRKKLVLCLVGLPARGKSYIAYKLVGYLRWRGLRAQLFNVGKHRREAVKTNQDAGFFDSNNANAASQRDAIAMEVLDHLLDWLQDGGDVAVFDATNTTNKRRWEVVGHCHQRSPMLRVIFIESICDDSAVLQSNYLSKCKNSPDYASIPLEEALADLKKRIGNYEKVYEPLADDHLSYLKLINLNSKVICNKIHGSLGHLISAYLMSIHIQPRPIYLVRTGKCVGEERIPYSQRVSDIGTPDSPFHMPFTINMAAPLTEKGKGFAKRLSVFMQQQAAEYVSQMKQPLASLMASMGLMNPATSPTQGKREMFNAFSVTDLDEPESQNSSSNRHATSSNPSIDPPPFSRGHSRSVDLPLIIYTSTLPRAAQTVEHMANQAIVCEQTSALNMMDTGDCHGLTLDAIRQRYPDQLKLWDAQRYTYRFPGGESQSDKARSLESLVMEIERHFFPVLVVSHASTLQVLYGYFFGPSKSVNDYYSLHIPQHHVIELRPHQYGWTERQWDLRSEEEKIEDKQMRQEIVERLEKQGKLCFNSVMDENSQIIADYLQGNESRRGSDRFMKANIDQLVENHSKPIVGTMNGIQPETVTHAAEFYEQ